MKYGNVECYKIPYLYINETTGLIYLESAEPPSSEQVISDLRRWGPISVYGNTYDGSTFIRQHAGQPSLTISISKHQYRREHEGYGD